MKPPENEQQNPRNRKKLSSGSKLGKYCIIKCIGAGGFGDIYLVRDSSNNFLALKTERVDAEKQALAKEAHIFHSLPDSKYFPKTYELNENSVLRYLSMEVLGPSITNLKRATNERKFSPNTYFFLAKQMLLCIQALHNGGFVHRDVKPSNFLLRPGVNHSLVLIDFGLSKEYRDSNGNLNTEIGKIGFKGTPKYASPYAHQGKDLGRRDDLFSWFFSVLEFVVPLPWTDTKDQEEILNGKKQITEFLKSEVDFTWELMYRTIEQMSFYDQPDYDYFLNEIDTMAQEVIEDGYDWESFDIIKQRAISFFPLKRVQRENEFKHFDIEDIVDFEKIRKKKRNKAKKEKDKQKEELEENMSRNISKCCLLL